MILSLVKTREDLGERNRRAVLAEILFHGPLPRGKIAERIGLTAASVSRISRDLIDAGLIEEGEEEVEDAARRGRRFIGLKVRSNCCFVAGIAINAFRQDVVIADLTNATLASRRLHIGDLSSLENVLAQSAELLNALIDETGIERRRLIGCGLTVTGAIDPERGWLRSAPMTGWKDVAAAECVSAILNVPVFMDSIPNAKNLTAHGFGSTKGVDNVLLFNASLAIGCSLLLDGRLLRGSEGNVGLIEGIQIPDASGNLKSLDYVAGGIAVIDAEQGIQPRNSEQQASALMQIIAQGNAGESVAVERLQNAGSALAYVVSMANALLHPDVILVSGPLADSEVYCTAMRQRLSVLTDPDFVLKRLRVSHMTSFEAAQSLAIYQSLVQGQIKSQVAG